MDAHLMATEREISQHERVLERVIAEFNRKVAEAMQSAQDTVASLGTDATRQDIIQAFEPVRIAARSAAQELDGVLRSNIEINQATLAPDISAELVSAVDQLKTQTIDRVIAQVEQEQAAVIETVVLAGIAGAVATDLTSQTRQLMQKATTRLQTSAGTGVMQFDTVVTRLRAKQQGVKRFRYVGGVIDTTRPFCASLDGGVYTEDEIQDIWNDTWAGKQPGDPFVVRGGYNCRHFWVPVEEE